MQKYILLLLSLVLMSPLGIDLYLPTLPQVAEGLQTSVSNIQTTIPLFILIMGIGQLVAGPLVDNFGRKPIALLGILLYLLGSSLAALSQTWPLFLCARVIQGTAVCCSAVVAFCGVRDKLSGEDAARAYSFLNGALNIVPALAPLLGGLLAQHWGWRAPFWFLCGYGVSVGMIILLWLPETRPQDTARTKLLPIVNYFAILRQSRFILFALANAGALGMVITYVSLAPIVLMERMGLSSLSFSIIFGANGIWIMVVSAWVNRVIRKMGRPFCLGTGALCMLVATILLSVEPCIFNPKLVNHWLGYMIPVAISVAGLAFIIGPATSYALEPFQQQAGVASALQGFIQMAVSASVSLAMLKLPLSPEHILALMMGLGASLAAIAWRCSLTIRGCVQQL